MDSRRDFLVDNFDIIYESLFLTGRCLGGLFLANAATVLARDLAWYGLNLPTRNQTLTTKNCYDWFEHYLPKPKTSAEEKEFENIDYSEGLFDFSKPSMTLQEATLHKYEYIFEQLGLRPGMTLLDAGCGSGVWMDFCRSKGVGAIGLTLSPEQANVVKAKGLEVEVRDYRLENPAFIGRFDRITALGSTEHVCSSMGAFAKGAARDRSIKTLTETWSLLQRYLKPDGKIFITALTVNEEASWSLKDYLQVYVLDSHYGGYYPRMSDIQYKVAPAANLHVSHIQDQTASYHWASMVEPRHFGYYKIDWSQNTGDKVSYIFTSFFKSPLQFPFHWLYQGLDTWMWQFGGPQKTPLTNEQVAEAPMQLKYFMLSKPSSASLEMVVEPTSRATFRR
jgi:cyclopropane fatty-acyl-phospholipid synthase-like methyltransferase